MVTFLVLAWPFILFLVLLAAAVVFGPSDTVELLLPIGVTQVVVSGSSLVFGKALLAAAALGALAIPAFRDYSRLYPLDLRFSVFLDDDGLRDAWSRLQPRDTKHFPLADGWPQRKREILASWNALIAAYPLPPHVRIRESTSGTGYATFRVIAVKGWQAYQIASAEGHLTLHFDLDGQTTQLRSDFELVHGPSSRIDGSLADIYLRWTKVIRPRFEQLVQVAPLQRISVGELMAVTKLRFFPTVAIGRTVYLAQTRTNGGELAFVPIAYAVYET